MQHINLPTDFDHVVLNVNRVSRVVKGGRRFRNRAVVVIGNRKGRVGVGVAKGADRTIAIQKAVNVAQRNLIQAVIEEPTTIPHEVLSKVGGAKILLKPANDGTGIIAGDTVQRILDLAGYHNIYSKSLGRTNKINVAYAVMEALKQLQPKDKWHINLIKETQQAVQS
ncbi:MAG: 30S ribosomal protein S5 [Candidatus Saccharibacteria bacterium]|nr:30S ribosomal protein S5 [Candidatus Saccharibacteria bacterium]MCY4089061.1 30S ribosomal protein S5 [Candidatus Saccharibacteria bacterium]